MTDDPKPAEPGMLISALRVSDLTKLRETVSAMTPGPYRYMPWHIEEGPSAVRCAAGWIVANTASDADAAGIAASCQIARFVADPESVERVARSICSSWDYEWDGDPDGDSQVAPETSEGWDDRPSKALYRSAAVQILTLIARAANAE